MVSRPGPDPARSGADPGRAARRLRGATADAPWRSCCSAPEPEMNAGSARRKRPRVGDGHGCGQGMPKPCAPSWRTATRSTARCAEGGPTIFGPSGKLDAAMPPGSETAGCAPTAPGKRCARDGAPGRRAVGSIGSAGRPEACARRLPLRRGRAVVTAAEGFPRAAPPGQGAGPARRGSDRRRLRSSAAQIVGGVLTQNTLARIGPTLR